MPYSLLDERTKKTNRDSLREAVRTLMGYGYNIEPPDQEASEYFFHTSLGLTLLFSTPFLWESQEQRLYSQERHMV